MVALDRRLAAIIKGAEQPRDEAERLALAQQAYDKALHATAARLWAEALTANPKLGDDRTTGHRYNAACSAAQAGCGQGNDDPPLDEAARAKFRNQALEWLKIERAVWSRLLESGPPQTRTLVAQILEHWQVDPDLVGVREEKELAKLPEPERAAFKKLWSDVDSLLTKARGGR